MWSYYGAKTNIVHLYPPPKYGKIIEPFAGTARYSLKYWDREVLLVDKYDVIVKIWKWLQKCSSGDILKLPRLQQGERISKYKFDCIEAQWLIGFIIAKGLESPRQNITDWVAIDRPNYQNYTIQKIAKNLHKIKHWQIECFDYREIKNQDATWFIDPPYQFGGHSYKHSNKAIDFEALSKWCTNRCGQVIICEVSKATWMPFIPLASQKGTAKMQSEVFWTNLPTSYSSVQTQMF